MSRSITLEQKLQPVNFVLCINSASLKSILWHIDNQWSHRRLTVALVDRKARQSALASSFWEQPAACSGS